MPTFESQQLAVQCAYMDRDKDTFTELQAPIEEAMRPLYRSMHIAQRSVGIKPGNEPSWAEQTDSWQEQIALFRHMKGLRAVRAMRSHALRSCLACVCMSRSGMSRSRSLAT